MAARLRHSVTLYHRDSNRGNDDDDDDDDDDDGLGLRVGGWRSYSTAKGPPFC